MNLQHETFQDIKIIHDKTNGLVELSLTPRKESDRTFRILNNSNGRFASTPGKKLHDVMNQLNQEINTHLAPHPDQKILGMFEGSLTFAPMLAHLRGCDFLTSTKATMADNGFVFLQGTHLNASFFVHDLQPGDQVIIIEDEITTGNGVISLTHSIRKFGAQVVGIATLLEITNYDPATRIATECSLPLISLIQAKLQ